MSTGSSYSYTPVLRTGLVKLFFTTMVIAKLVQLLQDDIGLRPYFNGAGGNDLSYRVTT